jgi:5-methylcytosine-specific restriction enzyme A
MPTRPPRPCRKCGQPATAGGLCERHKAQQRAHIDDQRGTARQRGYDETHSRRFRQSVLDRDGWTCAVCGDEATVADHHPLTRRELEARGFNPNNPDYGRALCIPCHNRHTANTSTPPRNLRH